MCVICVMFEQDRLTVNEAKSALSEMVGTEQIDSDHAIDVAEMIYEKVEEDETSDEEQESK